MYAPQDGTRSKSQLQRNSHATTEHNIQESQLGPAKVAATLFIAFFEANEFEIPLVKDYAGESSIETIIRKYQVDHHVQ